MWPKKIGSGTVQFLSPNTVRLKVIQLIQCHISCLTVQTECLDSASAISELLPMTRNTSIKNNRTFLMLPYHKTS